MKNKIVFSVFYTYDKFFDEKGHFINDTPVFLTPFTHVIDCTSTVINNVGRFVVNKEKLIEELKFYFVNFEYEDLKNITIRVHVEKYSDLDNPTYEQIYVNNFLINAYRAYKYLKLI